MVRACLDGTKTQTRRVVKPKPPADKQRPAWYEPGVMGWAQEEVPAQHWHRVRCPYGHPGARLWVREAWMPDPPCDGTWGYTAWAGSRIGQISAVPERFRKPEFCNYRATWPHKEGSMRWTPGIHMPRWASRITLEVTGVRVERLQDISEADAKAEGCARLYDDEPGYVERDEPDWKLCPQCGGTRLYTSFNHATGGATFDTDCGKCDTYVKRYQHLWTSINGPESWAANPFVWVVEFNRKEEA